MKQIGTNSVTNGSPTKNEDGKIIVNETAIRLLGIDDPIGKEIENGIIIGVIKDFILHSFHSEIPALIIQQDDSSRISNILIYTESETNEIATNSIRTVWNELFPESLISIETFSDVFDDMYERKINMDKTISLFAIVAMMISSLGLFGMAHFTTRKRIKEIGLRKVNGANTKDIISLIHRESLTPYLISILCFLPLTYLFALEWFANFTHSSSIGIWDILISILASFIVFSTPIIFISYKASTGNPIRTLKYE